MGFRNYIEIIRLKFRRIYILFFKNQRRKLLINTDFTIISNNCWGGTVYQSYNLPYNSMTIGLFIMSKDYIKFLSDLEKYLNMDLVFIKIENSKYFISGELSKSTNYPIGLLEDVEIHFLHYDNEIEAKEKWDKRKKRVNLNNLIIKYNNQNGFEESDLEEFDKLSYKNKLFFTNDNNILPKYGYFIKSSGESIRASYEPIIGTKIMNLTYYLNLLK